MTFNYALSIAGTCWRKAARSRISAVVVWWHKNNWELHDLPLSIKKLELHGPSFWRMKNRSSLVVTFWIEALMFHLSLIFIACTYGHQTICKLHTSQRVPPEQNRDPVFHVAVNYNWKDNCWYDVCFGTQPDCMCFHVCFASEKACCHWQQSTWRSFICQLC